MSPLAIRKMSRESNTAPLRFTFLEHLALLRAAVIRSLIVFIIAAALAYNFSSRILSFLIKPIGTVVFISPQEGFITHIAVALFCGLFISSPYIIYQAWRFISCGLHAHEKKHAVKFSIASFILFGTGCLSGYYMIISAGLPFLLGFAAADIKPMITLGRYICFIITFTLLFGVVFQLPLAVIFLSRIGLVNQALLRRRRKEVIITLFIAAAIFTPPDAVTQVLLALPLVVLYEVSILLIRKK